MNILQGTRQPPTNSKELSKPNMSVLARLRNPGLCSPAAYTHTHTHTRLTICTLTHTHVPAWELQDDVMPGRPTRACGETQCTWGTSPFPCRPLTSPSPPSHILLWSPVGPEGNLTADGVSLSHILCGQIRLHQQQL